MIEILKHLEHFHGHLGPYAVIGYKMGVIANEKLGANPFDKQVQVKTGTTPPLSCIIDGIQYSSGCTLGKGNISVETQDDPTAIFTNKQGSSLSITLKQDIRTEIDTKVTEENIIEYSKEIFTRSTDELFIIQ